MKTESQRSPFTLEKKKISNLKIFPHAANRSHPFIFFGLLGRNSFKFRIPHTHAEAESSAFCVHTYVNTLSAEAETVFSSAVLMTVGI